MENSGSIISKRLPVVFCLLVDFPKNSTISCAKSSKDITGNVCFECAMKGSYLAGESLDDHGSAGHVICIILWILIMIVGTFGTFTNCLIIQIMRKQKNDTRKGFDLLLMILASFDLLSSLTSIIAAFAMITYFEDWDRGPVTLFLYYMPFLLCLLGRSGSSYMTVLITVERYAVIADPIRSNTWFTYRKTKVMALGVIIFAILINIPRLSSLTVDYNEMGRNIPSLHGREYIIRSTTLEKFWYDTLHSVHYQIDIWVPFPLLLLFNILLFLEIKKFTDKRRQLTKKQQGDIRAARMFVPVVVVLFLCNIEPISHYAILHFTKMYYRELVMGLTLSIAVNSAANLPIYYARGPSFRQEIRAALPDWCGYLKTNMVDSGDISMTPAKTGPGSSTEWYH